MIWKDSERPVDVLSDMGLIVHEHFGGRIQTGHKLVTGWFAVADSPDGVRSAHRHTRKMLEWQKAEIADAIARMDNAFEQFKLNEKER